MIGIRLIENEEDLRRSVDIVRASFATVAEQLGLTPDNCPTHPAFITYDRLAEKWGICNTYFGLFENDKQAGFVIVEKNSEHSFCIERLAVLPEYRHLGFGSKLMSFAFDYIKSSGGADVSIAIVNENSLLKHWYEEQGFAEIELKRFDHLPFTVCYMVKYLV